MVRISSAGASRKRKKKVFRQAKGQFGQRKNRFKQAIRSVIKGMAYSYRDRKVKKREFRALWIIRINAACREEGISYSRFIYGLINASIEIDRKMLAELAVSSPEVFQEIVKKAKENQCAKIPVEA